MTESTHFLLATTVCRRFPPGPVRQAWLCWIEAARVGDPQARELAREAVRITKESPPVSYTPQLCPNIRPYLYDTDA